MNKSNVYILGAGFSAPAKLPIQNAIVKEMCKPFHENSFYEYNDKTSVKFTKAYIIMGEYLLSLYTNINVEEFDKVLRLGENISNNSINESKLYKELTLIAEKIRKELIKINVPISLEDIFTSFDKSFQEKEYINNHSYLQANKINNSIKKLFSYYFSRSIQNYNFDCDDYNLFINRIKKQRNVTIITTNWDILLEEYFRRKNINYNLCLNEKYYFLENESISNSKDVDLIKLHGSINWYRCNNCGKLLICNNEKCGEFLFDDKKEEQCFVCKQKAKEADLLTSEIITPTMLKSLRTQTYINLWSVAKSKLLDAKEVTFIGYSLPIADFDLRYMLRNTIPANAIINVILSANDKPKKSNEWLMPEIRYREIFPKNEIHFHYAGFGEYFKK